MIVVDVISISSLF